MFFVVVVSCFALYYYYDYNHFMLVGLKINALSDLLYVCTNGRSDNKDDFDFDFHATK